MGRLRGFLCRLSVRFLRVTGGGFLLEQMLETELFQQCPHTASLRGCKSITRISTLNMLVLKITKGIFIF